MGHVQHTRVYHFVTCSGAIGSGSRMKLCVNMVLGTFVSGLAEGLSLADSVGLRKEDLWDILQQGAMACPVVTVKGKGTYATQYPVRGCA